MGSCTGGLCAGPWVAIPLRGVDRSHRPAGWGGLWLGQLAQLRDSLVEVARQHGHLQSFTAAQDDRHDDGGGSKPNSGEHPTLPVNDWLNRHNHQPDLLPPPWQSSPHQSTFLDAGLSVSPPAGQARDVALGHTPPALENVGTVQAATP